MKFNQTNYLRWYMPRVQSGDGAVNLHSSGVPAVSHEEFEPAQGDPWTMVPRFEAGLGEWLDVPPEEICFTPGATGGTLLALMTLAGPGDELLVEAPIYEPMLRQARRLNSVRRFTRRMESGWRLPLDEIKDKISSKTRVVMVTEPSNPSGVFCDRKEMLELAEIAAGHDALLLVNEVYRKFSDAPSYHREAENIVVVSSTSKLLGTYGLRLGWLSGPAETTARLRAAHMNMSMPTQAAAAYGIDVLARAEDLRQRVIETVAVGVDVVDSWVQVTDGIEWIRPMGPGFGCVKIPESAGDDVRFAEKLHKERGVLVIPGSFFEVPGSIRLSWLQVDDRLEQGLDLIAGMLKDSDVYTE
ncbi:MAG: pyridoxal phosphate-dependent aminotransferase [Deltaproteobacteria bacterium]|nr:pyridoxal phosphate-dependent aminotransferase [Deltaproteobacteria bacterium]